MRLRNGKIIGNENEWQEFWDEQTVIRILEERINIYNLRFPYI